MQQVASIWWDLTRSRRAAFRAEHRKVRYSVLSDIDRQLQDDPMSIDVVEGALSDLVLVEPFDRRVSACILGVSTG